MEALLSPEEVAELLKIARVTVYSWAEKGLLPHYKLGIPHFTKRGKKQVTKGLRFSEDDVKAFIESRYVKAKKS